MLTGIDTLVLRYSGHRGEVLHLHFDDGVRARSGGSRGIPIYVLDRPNPITGTRVEGPILDRENQSFIGYFPMPIRHGMTMARLRRCSTPKIISGPNLRVVPMKNWSRGDWFDSTGLAGSIRRQICAA